MEDNVLITVRERGKICARRQGHNVWVEFGRSTLAQLVSYLSIDPDLPVIDYRIKYMQFGIGSASQSNSALADNPPFSTSYQPGEDWASTNGHEYNKEVPTNPNILGLERPVRISGSEVAYPGTPGDIWYKEIETATHPTPHSTSFRCTVYPTFGEIVYGSFAPIVPLSEVGLIWSDVDSLPNQVYVPFIAAYFNFDTINLNQETILEIIWTVKF